MGESCMASPFSSELSRIQSFLGGGGWMLPFPQVDSAEGYPGGDKELERSTGQAWGSHFSSEGQALFLSV